MKEPSWLSARTLRVSPPLAVSAMVISGFIVAPVRWTRESTTGMAMVPASPGAALSAAVASSIAAPSSPVATGVPKETVIGASEIVCVLAPRS